MSNPTLHNLNEGGPESIRALIQALAPEIASNSNGSLSSAEVANVLTEKLAELVGPAGAEVFSQHRNERGELVNEEGLPIIEIAEPVNSIRLPLSASLPTPITVEPLIPLASLPPSTQEKLRERRKRILDLLEDEEAEVELAEKRRQAGEMEEIVRKRKEQAGKEQDRVKEARELQKRMGRSLLQNIGMAKEKERQEQEDQRLRDEEADRRRSPSIKKKTVAFAESPENFEKEPAAEYSTSIDWGEIAPGRLRSTKKPTLMSQALLDRHPMKLSVIERVPGGQPTISKASQLAQNAPDSDDDSEPESVPDSSDTEAEEEEPTLENDEVDLDFAQHQREIALEYYTKRNIIGQDAAAAMMNPSHDIGVHTETFEDTPQETPKPSISQFKATRFASAYNASAPSFSGSQSTSLGTSILPASSARKIQRAIRTGKLDSDARLVGGEAESASEEEDESFREVLELLRKGEVYNLGPDGEYIHTIPPTAGPSSSSSAQVQQSSQHTDTLPPPSMRSKTSKFKASRVAAGRPSTSSQISIPSPSVPDPLSPSITPVSHAGRSSPKLAAPASPKGAERNLSASTSSIHSPSPGKSGIHSPSPFSMIVDSPSFPMPQGLQDSRAMPSMVIDSPSFPPVQKSRRLDRPPTVVSSVVRESKIATPPERQTKEDDDDMQPKRVSRFKAERM